MRRCHYCARYSSDDCPVCHGTGWYHVDYEAEWHEVQHRFRATELKRGTPTKPGGADHAACLQVIREGTEE